MSDLIHFECPQCRKSLSAKPKHAGRSTKCPGCERLVTVPSPEVETEDFVELEEVAEPTAPPSQRNPRDELYQQLSHATDSGATDQALAIIAQLKVDAASDEFTDLWALERELTRAAVGSSASNLGEANSRPMPRETSVAPPTPSFERPPPPIPSTGLGPQPVVYAMPQQASWPTHPFTFPPPTPSLPVPPQYQAIPPNYTPEGRPGDATATKTCPACAEVIKAEAAKCRFCGHEFNGGTNPINPTIVAAIATALAVVTIAVVLVFQWPTGNRLRESAADNQGKGASNQQGEGTSKQTQMRTEFMKLVSYFNEDSGIDEHSKRYRSGMPESFTKYSKGYWANVGKHSHYIFRLGSYDINPTDSSAELRFVVDVQRQIGITDSLSKWQVTTRHRFYYDDQWKYLDTSTKDTTLGQQNNETNHLRDWRMFDDNGAAQWFDDIIVRIGAKH